MKSGRKKNGRAGDESAAREHPCKKKKKTLESGIKSPDPDPRVPPSAPEMHEQMPVKESDRVRDMENRRCFFRVRG